MIVYQVDLFPGARLEQEAFLSHTSSVSISRSKEAELVSTLAEATPQPQGHPECTETEKAAKAEAVKAGVKADYAPMLKQAACPQVQQKPDVRGVESKQMDPGKAKEKIAGAMHSSRILSKNAIAAAALKKAANGMHGTAKAEGWDSDSDLDLSKF